MFRLLREMLKPARDFFRDADYREWLRIKAACRNKPAGTPVETEIAGFRVKGNDAPALLHQYEEIFRKRAFDVDFGKEDPYIWSCGTNIGLEIFFFKKHYPESRIVAYEADPEIAKVLEENIEANRIADVRTFAAAVSTKNGTIAFRADRALGGKTGEGSIEVPCVRLADELAKEKQIDLLLMDIEGAEWEVLNDCAPQLKKVERLFVEWHGSEKTVQHLQSLLTLLSGCGFRYRLSNHLPDAPFRNRLVENGFDAMVEIYATR